jgi:CRISPR-associated exonuclease Cas4
VSFGWRGCVSWKRHGRAPAVEPLDWIVISALEHWSYCPRQCRLIHLEQTFDENYYTVRGTAAHERADGGRASTEHGVRIEREVPVWSDSLALIGKVDTLEWSSEGVPYPVEYKSGRKRGWVHEAIQLCAQAVCLEEMFGCAVPRGAISYLASRQRREIEFDSPLRRLVVDAATAVRAMLDREHLPPAVDDARCLDCSLPASCLPGVLVDHARIARLAADLFVVRD